MPTKANISKEPGIKMVAAAMAEYFSLSCRLIAWGLETAIGYLSAPHDWHMGAYISSIDLQ